MKLQQLRYAVEVFRRNLNVSDAADALFTSQPGVSKQIKLLEEELGVQIFIRSGKRIVAVTPAGEAVLQKAEQILQSVQNIRNIGSEFSDTNKGTLIIAATHSLLRFKLPHIVANFQAAFPDVRLILKQGSPTQIADWVHDGLADLALGKDAPDDVSDLKKLPCGQWHYMLYVPINHALTQLPEISLSDITAYPLLTYGFTFQAGSVASRAFSRARIHNYVVAFESDDAMVLQQYAKQGLGVALIDNMAKLEEGMQKIDVSHLFETSQYHILLRSDVLVRGYVYDFIEMLNPELTREKVDKWLYAPVVEDFSI